MPPKFPGRTNTIYEKESNYTMLYNTRYPNSFFCFLYSLPSDPLLFLHLLLSFNQSLQFISRCYTKLAAKLLQLCLTLCDPMDCSLPGSSVHGVLQARILPCVVISFSRGIFLTQGSNPCLLHLLHRQASSLLTTRATWEAKLLNTM